MTKRIIFIGMIIAFLALNVVAVRTLFTAKYPGANDFFQRWYGARAFFVDGKDTYSAEVSLGAEIALYGRPASKDPALDEYPGDFLYPFHYAILIAPLSLLPYDWASAIWMVIIAAGAGLSFLLMADLYRWRMRPITLILGTVWAVTFYPAARALLLGQQGAVVVVLQIIAVYAYVIGGDVLVGILLSLSTIKPQIGFLIIPFLLLASLRARRWKVVVSFSVTSVVLIALSFLLLPTWFGSFLEQISHYTSYTATGSPAFWVITHQVFPFLGTLAEYAISALLVAFTVWSWWRVIWKNADPDLRGEFLWASALTLAVTHLVAPRTATPQFIAYYPVLVLLFREVARNRRNGRYLLPLVMVGLSVALWILFLTTIKGKFEHPVNYLPLPILSLAVLILWRDRWLKASPRG